ncbi:DNA-binding transcriptional regulator Fis [Teredinibacter waterburyi]|jgi:Factor for inversion stimulation Fis, transcriptional activator|uniref:DNA-binding transcriptional regulator Fis n=1 Tax=Teredinibacter waterburyi TaxID=1500538 RepID=UPI00165FA577|nr:DNA-binding transcriptional regulator Fis [Teredinibacter waterburyi]
MNTAETLLRESPLEFKPATSIEEPQTALQHASVRDSVEKAVSNYFQHLDGQDVSDVYEMVLAEVEAPLLEVVMKYTRHNQTRAANVLGLNRGTLRKKLKQYGLL